ncbi:all trans-polyprenyl-diphosphate synthase PDSS2 [Stomoxys calcitrans]|nr:all trans-polyprenyl-diphosphate synthase PDSS2 [Stomoxys calcitrans]XP_059216139.1 all trans-polyprenyl-diphosphate synthase PDSS2 [Stomoxys calcitrans]XP_059216140.1 all trans-polyprenyl-diphosphate synthase PDSS2 [Stomoxys calcitrans]
MQLSKILLPHWRKFNQVQVTRKLAIKNRKLSVDYFAPLLKNETFTLMQQQQQQQISYQQIPRRWATTSAIHSTTTITKAAKPSPPKHDWNRAVSEAERIVGYPNSFLSLRWLLSDEIANVALYLRKLVGSNHPLLKTAKGLLYNGKNTTQAWSLIVLLISKAAGHAPSVPDMEQDKSAGVLHSQRVLVEVTEMIRISHLVHNSLVNLQRCTKAGQDSTSYDDMTVGNKIGLLVGDYLLSYSSVELADLKNQIVVGLISSAVRDFSESVFIGERDEQNNPLPSKPGTVYPHTNSPACTVDIDYDAEDILKPMNIVKLIGNPEKEWVARNMLNVGSLLSKSCLASLQLAEQSEYLQKKAYLFGKHLSLAWQACLDAEPFQLTSLPYDTSFSLVSAPVLFHLEYDPKLYDEIEKGKVCVDNVDYVKIHQAILQGPGLEKTKQLQRKHTTAALHVLESFPNNDARKALENIIIAMQDL